MTNKKVKVLVEIELDYQDKLRLFNSTYNTQLKVLNDESKIITINTVYPKGFEGFRDDLLNLFEEKLSHQI